GSVGGSEEFNRMDGLLMQIKDRTTASAPASPAEYFYSWWHPEAPSPRAPGLSPGFRGKFGAQDTVIRSPALVDMWNAVTVVSGISNADDVTGGNPDSSDSHYTVEMMFNLDGVGYNITDTDGDIVAFNISIYDTDWFWPPTFFLSANRTWWQGPWGNSHGYNSVRIHARPSVTISSGTLPVLAPELIIPNGAGSPAPVIDGQLNDAAWALAPQFDIRYGDDALRLTYPSIGKWLSGQYQPPIAGNTAFITDRADCTVRYFFRADSLYLGFDVRDEVVQYSNSEDLFDGFRVSLNEYSLRDPQDKVLQGRRLTFQVGPTGTLKALDYLPYLRDTVAGARAHIYLKPGTTIENPAVNVDNGYQAEMVVDLTKLGYPAGRGEGRVHLGITHFDGDQYPVAQDTYGNRVWWFREYDNTSGPVWAYMDPTVPITAVGDEGRPIAPRLLLAGASPNPFRLGTYVRFSLPQAANVTIDVFDLAGRRVTSLSRERLAAGEQQIAVAGREWAAGLYLYRLRAVDPATGAELASANGRMLRLR
ncbi:MAG: T9SS type A sorting domain-containing protein, partial [Candidatus Eisenbacteria bacterium]